MLDLWEIVARLFLAAFLGSLIGLEREERDKSAGLRTHMMVCVGSALFMIVSIYGFDEVQGREDTTFDPSRVAAQVVTGIGFLGAGIIIFRREAVRGLTTAAGVWSVAGVGLAVGGGLYVTSVVATGVIMLVLAGLGPIEAKIWGGRKGLSLNVLAGREASIQALEVALRDGDCTFKELRVGPSEDETDCYVVTVVLDPVSREKAAAVMDRLKGLSGVKRVELGK
jgi:putative Mg2+ transporter-C (MgtC) family protein